MCDCLIRLVIKRPQIIFYLVFIFVLADELITVMHTRLFEMHPFLPIRSLFKLFYITSAFCSLFRPDVFRFNHDDVVCEGDHYLFNCELNEYLADGVLGIYKLENEFIPANLSAQEKEVAEIFKKDPYPNLVIWSLREIFEEHGVHKWVST